MLLNFWKLTLQPFFPRRRLPKISCILLKLQKMFTSIWFTGIWDVVPLIPTILTGNNFFCNNYRRYVSHDLMTFFVTKSHFLVVSCGAELKKFCEAIPTIRTKSSSPFLCKFLRFLHVFLRVFILLALQTQTSEACFSVRESECGAYVTVVDHLDNRCYLSLLSTNTSLFLPHPRCQTLCASLSPALIVSPQV